MRTEFGGEGGRWKGEKTGEEKEGEGGKGTAGGKLLKVLNDRVG